MSLPRYTFHDPYIIEELRRKYQHANAKGRIRLLRNLNSPPYEIALLAVEDTDIEVRQWFARYGKLDYREKYFVNGFLGYKFPERNLEYRLKNDPDTFVSACLQENPNAWDTFNFARNTSDFQNATQMERLAYMRSSRVGNMRHYEFIEKLFDSEDTELGITLEQRKELILAFLTNTEAVSVSQQFNSDPVYIADGYGSYRREGHFSRLWRLASKWPKDFAIQGYIYRYLGTTEETMEEIYRTCDDPWWRLAILEHCCESEDLPHKRSNTRLLELGMQDPDDRCRMEAYSIAFPISFVRILESVLQSEDKCALLGMASNNRLPVDILLKVKERLSELGEWENSFFLGWQIQDRKDQKSEKQENKDSEILLSNFEKLKEDVEKKTNKIEKILGKSLASIYRITLFTFFITLILLILLFFVNK